MGSISPSKNEQVFEAVSILLMGIHPVVLTVTLIAQKQPEVSSFLVKF